MWVEAQANHVWCNRPRRIDLPAGCHGVDAHRGEYPAYRCRTILTLAKAKEKAIHQSLDNRVAHLQRTLNRLTPAQREGLITGLQVLAEEMARDRA